MSNLTNIVDEINKLKPIEVAENELVKKQFIHIWNTVWGDGGESAYEKESRYFYKVVSDSDNLKKCTPFSFFTCFIDLAVCGLSLEPGSKALCYFIPKSHAIGKDKNDKKIYEPRCTLQISGYGELALRAKAGQIKYADDPVVIYQNDSFSAYEKEGRKHVDYVCNLPHKGQPIIGCYIRIVRSDGSVDYSWLFDEDIERLKGYSKRANKRYDYSKNSWVENANELYTSQNGGIDTGFLRAKTIKHAFASYPKVRIGKDTLMETETEQEDYYSLEGPTEDKLEETSSPFGEEPTVTGGVKIVDSTQEDDGAF